MGDVEILVEENGYLKVVQHYNLRFLLRLDDLQRRLVVSWWNCRQNCQDHTFVLKCLFVFTLLCGLCRMLSEQFMSNSIYILTLGSGIFLSYQLLWVGILFMAMLTAVFAFWLLMKMRTTAPPLRKGEVKTITGLIQHL